MTTDVIPFYTPSYLPPPIDFQLGSMPPPSSVALSGTSLSQPSPSVSQHSIMSSLASPSQTLSACPLSQDQLVVDTPLVVSSALPPVPGKLVRKVQSGMFVDMKEILSDNVSLLQRLGEISSGQLPQNPSLSVKLREVPDILTWVYCFLEYISIRSQDKFTRDLCQSHSPPGSTSRWQGMVGLR